MKKTIIAAAALLGACLLVQAADAPWQAIGRPATPAEIKAWDIDVRADFQGLPKGRGSVAQGEQIWENRCAGCHGSFGESNEVFTPIVGGTSDADIKSGHVAALSNGSVPQRTTLMKVARLSTLWDYINRAMPWDAPKSLSADEVYAVTAHILNLGGVVPSDFVLSNDNIADVQQRLPNRNGLVRQPGLWDIKGKPDVLNTACMTNCPTEARQTSSLPDFARNAHGNLAEQNRALGGVRGTDTTRPARAVLAPAVAVAAAAPATAKAAAGGDAQQLLNKNGCLACHGVSNKIIGPALRDIAAKYQGRADRAAYLQAKIRSGGAGAWGAMPMPPQSQLKEADMQAIVQWLASGAQ
ncbi:MULTISPECIES: c-type cytochrome [unclassified Duganella]|uniref:c-type cytochrome n=1 Tax=unclassified Duganella TaxID=2636909 RepID=UPI0008743568|nr:MULTISPECIES: c-type cytochrome [unclassified Duganella]OEZ59945.1 cytochrome c-552 precursor [Duganella sp. HH105]OFA05906.1 cytochrome c-552 precursor [Duganella sp. HH101]